MNIYIALECAGFREKGNIYIVMLNVIAAAVLCKGAAQAALLGKLRVFSCLIRVLEVKMYPEKSASAENQDDQRKQGYGNKAHRINSVVTYRITSKDSEELFCRT
jgi:hypothetical protein